MLPIFDITCCCLIVTSNIRYFSAVEKIEYCEFIAKFDYLCTLNSNLGVLFSNLARDYWVPADKYAIKAPPDMFLPLPSDLAELRQLVIAGQFIPTKEDQVEE